MLTVFVYMCQNLVFLDTASDALKAGKMDNLHSKVAIRIDNERWCGKDMCEENLTKTDWMKAC